ncbi:MAG TPA: hypothetical protein VIK91_14285 [Nannocystis sp.]
MRFLPLLPCLALLACVINVETTTETGTDSAGSTSSSTTADTTGDSPATTGDPPATTGDNPTTTTGDDPTTGTTDDPSTGTTDDPGTTGDTTGAPLDDCEFLVGRTFKSDEELECGITPNGVELCHWTIVFTADTYSHHYSDVVEDGTYTCDAGVITAKGAGQMSHGGTIDAAAGELVWDGVVYHP